MTDGSTSHRLESTDNHPSMPVDLTPPPARRFRNSVYPNPGATRVPNGRASDPDVASTLVHSNSIHRDTVRSLLSPTKTTLFQEELQEGGSRDQHVGHPKNDETTYGMKTVKGLDIREILNPSKTVAEVEREAQEGHEDYLRSHNADFVDEKIDRKYDRSHFSQDGCFRIAGSTVGKAFRWLGETLKSAPNLGAMYFHYFIPPCRRFCLPNPAWKRAGTKEMMEAQIGQTTKAGENTFHLPPDHTFGKVMPQDEFGVGELIHSKRRLVNAVRHRLRMDDFQLFPSLLRAFSNYDETGEGRIPKEDLLAVCRQFRLDVITPALDVLVEPDRDGLVDIREAVDLLNWKDEKPDDGRDQSPTTARQLPPARASASRAFGVPSVRSDLSAPGIRRVDDTNDSGDRPTVAELGGSYRPLSKEMILYYFHIVCPDLSEETREEAWSLAATKHPSGEISLHDLFDALVEIKINALL